MISYASEDVKALDNLNPFRYRSYYYDTETGLYYLKSRYYDPEVGRFINIDSIEYADPETINGLNLYAYCGNNPIMGYDPEGTLNWGKIRDWFSTITGLLNLTSKLTMIGALIVAACQGRGNEITQDWNNGCFNPFNMDENIALNSNVFSFYKGESVIKQTVLPSSCQIAGTILLHTQQANSSTINHEFGHGIQERFLGAYYLTRVGLPSLITWFVNPSNLVYYSMPWERTADWFGGVNRTFTVNGVAQTYKKGSLGWSFAELVLGWRVLPLYFIFGF